MVQSWNESSQNAKNERRAKPDSDYVAPAKKKAVKKEVRLERKYVGPVHNDDYWIWSEYYARYWVQYFTAYRSVGSAVTAMNALNRKEEGMFEYRLMKETTTGKQNV